MSSTGARWSIDSRERQSRLLMYAVQSERIARGVQQSELLLPPMRPVSSG